MDKNSTISDLVAQLRGRIRQLSPGDRLPTSRHLVETHRVSPITVSRAVSILAREGLIVTRPGAGTFVSEPPTPGPPIDYSWQTVALADRSIDLNGLSQLSDPAYQDDVISLGMGYLHPTLMPVRALSAALARASRLPDVWERPPTVGLRPLRSWFALGAGTAFDSNDVIITPGGQAAISATFRALIPAGAPLLVESPTYHGALAVARAAGIRPVPVPTDAEGVIPGLLAEAFARTGAQAFYCQPTYHNPTGAILAPSRRTAVLEAAAAAGAFVIEDDYARWLSHGGQPPAPLLTQDDDGRVVYITSLTKVVSASLRIGAVIARGPVADRLRSMRLVDDMFVARPIQEATLELVSSAAWTHHLRALAGVLDRRSRQLARAVATHLPACSTGAPPTGGLHLWVELPRDLDDSEVAFKARHAGVIVLAGNSLYPAETPGPHLRLTFSGAPTERDLDTGVRRLAAAVPELANR